MSQTAFINMLVNYRELVLPKYDLSQEQLEDEWELCSRFISFVRENPMCFESDHNFPSSLSKDLWGHLTGSALVVNVDRSKLVLTLHKKLGKWLQLGGHADGNPSLDDVAKREAHEESGLKDIDHLNFGEGLERLVLPFDLDIHQIPASATKPCHYHYDVRFLMIAKDDALVISDESEDLRWFSFNEARSVSQEESLHQQFRKMEQLLKVI